MTTQIPHFIDGQRSELASTRTADVLNPSTGEVQAQVLLASAADVDTAVASAVEAQKEWAAWNPQRRARVMMKFVDLVNQNIDELAELLSIEHGKTVADSKGDIQRGIEVIEFAIGIPHLLKGEFTEGAGTRHRRLLAPPAARRRRRHHAVQLPGDDPAVEGRPRAGLRQRLHPQALRARPVGAGAAGRTVPRGRPARRACSRSCRATRRPSTPS